MHRPAVRPLYFIALVLAGFALALPASAQFAGKGTAKEYVVLFAAGGVRQDVAEAYALQGAMPALSSLLQNGTRAGGGLLTQAPAGAGAGWHALATGAWPGVHGAPGDTFSINGTAFGDRVSSLDPGALQAETLAQAVERGGRKVAQVEWPGGRVGAIDGPTVDGRTLFSGRGVATNYIAASDSGRSSRVSACSSITPPALRGSRPMPAPRRPRRAAGRTSRRRTAPRWRCACAYWISGSTSTASTPTSSRPATSSTLPR